MKKLMFVVMMLMSVNCFAVKYMTQDDFDYYQDKQEKEQREEARRQRWEESKRESNEKADRNHREYVKALNEQ